MDIMRQSAGLVVNPIKGYSYYVLFNAKQRMGQAPEWMTIMT